MPFTGEAVRRVISRGTLPIAFCLETFSNVLYGVFHTVKYKKSTLTTMCEEYSFVREYINPGYSVSGDQLSLSYSE